MALKETIGDSQKPKDTVKVIHATVRDSERQLATMGDSERHAETPWDRRDSERKPATIGEWERHTATLGESAS